MTTEQRRHAGSYPVVPPTTKLTRTGRLVGTGEIAKLLGVSRQRADQIIREKRFPEDWDTIDGGRVWKRSTVDKWIKANR